MKKIEIEIPEGKEAKWVNDVLTLVDEKPIEYKFKVGDKVKADDNQIYTVIGQFVECGEPTYRLKSTFGETSCAEIWLELVPQDITDRIKTFGDACLWCNKNGKKSLVDDFNEWQYVDKDVEDIIAYLKLRIITAALNEGWKQTAGKEDARYYPYFTDSDDFGVKLGTTVTNFPRKLCFKSTKFAEYAATQFKDIYADFFGCAKK